MSPICQLDHLTTGYRQKNGTRIVSSQLNASLRRGQMTCLLGANGTGKSTLIRTICGFLKPIEGQIILDGQNVTALSAREMSKLVSVVLTDRVDIPNATVRELVELGRSPYTGFMGTLSTDDREKAALSMKQTGIWHKHFQPVAQLSDGERQKALIAKALAQDTPLIVLDEPTAFLDLPARVEIMHLLRHLCMQEQKCILMTTHDLDLAMQMADKLWLLQPDQPLLSGSPEDLMLQNAFQPMFAKSGIEFDPRTGLFRIAHPHHGQLAVKGHGFGYVMLRRALSRRGIHTVGKTDNDQTWVEILGLDSPWFELFANGHRIVKTASAETVVDKAVGLANVYTGPRPD
ncbi:MAG: ABC transporter ATP-binding protein [Breznakibacter sp.]